MNIPKIEEWFEKAVISYRAGQVSEADLLCQSILNQDPDHAHTLNLAAAIRILLGQPLETQDLSKRAVALAPQDAIIRSGMSDVLFKCDRVNESLAAAETAINLDPNLGPAHVNRGKALMLLFRFSESRATFERALAIDPSFGHAVKVNLALLAAEEGRYETAKVLVDELAKIYPNDNSLALISARHSLYTPSITRAEERNRTDAIWSTKIDQITQFRPPLQLNLDPIRKLRLGYISADIARHPVSYFLKPVLEKRDPDAAFVKLYDVTPDKDDFSEQVHSLADSYHDGLGQSDATLAKTIHEDKIDI